jgi:hypothetical protein
MLMTTDAHAHDSRCWWDPTEARWVCPAPTTAIPMADHPTVDVRDMIVVHTALLREFRLAASAIRRVPAGERGRAAVAADRHLDLLAGLLHHHHRGEDELLWPLLRERAPASAVAALDRLEAQHADLDAALTTVADTRASWRAAPDEPRREALATALERLHGLLAEHLELEERIALPLAAALLTVAEWHRLGAAGAAGVPKPALLLVFGMFAYEGDPAVLRAMLAAAPPPARVLVPRLAPRAYARHASRLYGTGRP